MRTTLILLFAAALAGCSLAPEIPKSEQLAAIKASGRTYEAFEKALREGEDAWARRAESPENVRKAVAMLELAYAIDPNDRRPSERLTLALYYLGNYYPANQDEKEKLHKKGYDYGAVSVLLNPKVRDAVQKGQKLEEAIAANATPADVPTLYWMTVNLARVAEMKSLAVQASTAPKLKVVMETVYRLGPTYYWGGVHRFFGAYYVKAPAQKDPGTQSKREFDRACDEGKANLENFVLKAEYWATFVNERPEFEKILKYVLSTRPEDDDPALRLDNAEARKRAKALLEKADDLF
jgi:hypothetical protein